MSTRQILIIEDEVNLGTTLSEYLVLQNYDCKLAVNASEGRQLFESQHPSIVLMDIGLPDGNGLDLAREFRALRKDFVLLFLSALNDPETRVEGLEIGAEDYITKPFALKELILRLERIFKGQEESQRLPDVLIHGPLKIWFNRYELCDALGNISALGQKECAILKLLYKNHEKAVTREEIIENIWGQNKFPTNRTVDNYIVKLRKWSESDPDQHIKIESVRGVGYKLTIKKE
ncbi:MAG: response regulator transcription factor [Halobacteriovoraceae bacterium]|nr:response regulator transcription factor [Halobacteriovoraceae bacterium]MBT5094954.1 response regulator transcription factor [Halobacteriovoraceae bacterium]